jgi:hypothetical protein
MLEQRRVKLALEREEAKVIPITDEFITSLY